MAEGHQGPVRRTDHRGAGRERRAAPDRAGGRVRAARTAASAGAGAIARASVAAAGNRAPVRLDRVWPAEGTGARSAAATQTRKREMRIVSLRPRVDQCATTDIS